MERRNKKNIITYITIGLFLIVFSCVYGKEYYEYHKERIEVNKINLINKKINEDFEISQINEIENLKLYYTPNKNLLDEIEQMIENAKEFVYIEVYMFTEKRIKNAVIKAHKRGVDVKVILEKNPYLAANINNDTYQEFEKNGISVRWSDINNYTLNHSKLLLIDGLSIISTGNLSYANFTQNRDLFLFIDDNSINKGLLEVFTNDFEGTKKGVINENIVLSPENSRIKITKLILEAEKDIKIHIPYFSDDKIVNTLIDIKKTKGITINVIIPTTAENDDNTIKLIKEGINIYKIPKYKLHSKAILVDNKYLFIGSVNFSEYSFDSNREIGLLTKEEDIISEFNKIFELDIIK